MRRGDIVTVAAGSDDAGKPRPAVVVQSDDFTATALVTLCLLTFHAIDAPLLRLAVAPSADNSLSAPSWIMVDKITTVPRGKVGGRIGQLPADDVMRLNRSLLVFLGLAGG